MTDNKKHLVEMLEHLVNENEEAARIALHNFVVSSARQIHESMLSEDELDSEIDEGFAVVATEEYFGEDDMEAGDGEMDMGMDVEAGAAEDDLGDDMGDEMGDMDDMGDMGDEMNGEEVEVEKEAVVDALDAMEELTAKFRAIVGDEEGEEAGDEMDMDMDMDVAADGDMEGDLEMGAEDDMEESLGFAESKEVDEDAEEVTEAEVDEDAEEVTEEDETTEEAVEEAVSHTGGVVSATHGVDHDGNHGSRDSVKMNGDAKLPESEEADSAFDFDLTEEDFQDLEEGLKKIDVKMGGEQGGNKFAGEETQTKSPVAQLAKGTESNSKSMISKKDEHGDFDLEGAPSNDSLPHSGDNSKDHDDDGQSNVDAKAGGEQGGGKFAGTETNTKSPIGS